MPDGTVSKIYMGNCILAEIEAANIERRRLRKTWERQESSKIQYACIFDDGIFHLLESICAANMRIAGFHNKKSRGWRLRREMTTETNDPQKNVASVNSNTESQPVLQDGFNIDEFNAIIKAAKKGDLAASKKLAELFDKRPELAGRVGDLAARAIWHWIHSIAGENKHLHQALLCEIKQQRALLSREGSGTVLEQKAIDLFLVTWLQLYQMEVRDLSNPPGTLEYARHRMDRLDRLTKRHVKSLELLAKLRSSKTETNIESVVINNIRQPRKRRKPSVEPVNRIASIVDAVLQN
jgi:hypothetical protein